MENLGIFGGRWPSANLMPKTGLYLLYVSFNTLPTPSISSNLPTEFHSPLSISTSLTCFQGPPNISILASHASSP